MNTQAPNAGIRDGWRVRASKPVGLYGELPPLPTHPAAANASENRRARERDAVDWLSHRPG